jgi:DNA topoisomerase-3
VAKALIIAEKPSVAADIARVVGARQKTDSAWEGDTHVVSWAVGHMLELVEPEGYDEKYQRWKLADLPVVPSSFRREPIASTRKQLAALQKLIARKDVARLINACDAGREGELIFREIYRHAGTAKPVERLWLQSMTAASIRQSLGSPRRSEDVDGLADAADCRAESDWLIGMNATRALTVRLRTGRDRGVWSAGRVQTAALKMVVDRERLILAHEPSPYWLIKAAFSARGPEPHEYEGTWFDEAARQDADRITDPARRDAILARCRDATSALAKETRKDRFEAAPPLFDLTTLQREANRRHGLSARRVLEAAQTLYEGRKLITYPRTDSKALPSDYRDHVQRALQAMASHDAHGPHARRLLADGLQNQARNFNDAEVSDHFAIIPTGEAFPQDLHGIEREVFDLIVKRFLAAFHPPAVRTDVERITRIGPDAFRTRRSVLKVPGWRAVWGKEKDDEDASLPALPPAGAEGAPVAPLRVESEEKETRPPARLTEATLLNLMETAGKEVDDERLSQVLHDAGGIGTPATRADIIETLLVRDYIARCTDLSGKKALRATARGIRLVDALERIQLPQLTSPDLTAHLEDALRDMEHGKRLRGPYMEEVRERTREIIEKVRAFTFDTLYAGTEPVGTCPVCGAPVREMLRTYECSKGGLKGSCPFMLWKEASGRTFDRATAIQLLARRVTPPKAGFFTRQDREYEAILALDATHAVAIQPRAAAGGAAAAPEPDVAPVDVGPCPFHPALVVQRTAQGYRCPAFAKKECKLSLPLVLCQRALAPDDVKTLLTGERKTPVMEGFISKRGRPFRASLTLGDNARLKWEFPPREPGRGRRGADAAERPAVKRKEFPVDPQPIGRCPKHPKADVAETPTDYACREDGCKFRVPREVCQRALARDEVAALLKDGATPTLEGFVSKRGKPFSASLKVNKRKTAGWEFSFG